MHEEKNLYQKKSILTDGLYSSFHIHITKPYTVLLSAVQRS